MPGYTTYPTWRPSGLARLAVLGCLCVLGTVVQAETATVVIRFDDFAATSNFADYAKVLDTFVRYRIPVSMAVIPFAVDDASAPAGAYALHENSLDDDAVAFLQPYLDTGLVEIAQHGYNHRANRHRPDNTGQSEFAGMALEEQDRKIQAGRARLEELLGRPIDIFVPPYNSYDRNTLGVLSKNGYAILSATRNEPAGGTGAVKLLPDVARLQYLKPLVGFCRQHQDLDHPLAVVLMHIFDFKEVDAQRGYMTFDEFDNLLAWLAAQKDLSVSTLHGVAATYEGKALDSGAYETDRQYVRRYYLARSVFPLGFFPLERRFVPALPYPMAQDVPLERWQQVLVNIVGWLWGNFRTGVQDVVAIWN